MKVLVTGAGGFVGSHVMASLLGAGHEVTGTVRPGDRRAEEPGYLAADSGTDFGELLEGVDAVVHAAGVAHNPTRDREELKRLFAEGNREWTCRIAGAVADSGVRALIHLSSIAAAGPGAGRHSPDLGEEERQGEEPEPDSEYGRSKREAEPVVTALREVGKLGVNLRPPLIYGAGTKGNWAKLLSLAASGLPLPFASVANQRSYLGIGNLCDLLEAILRKSDRSDLSGTYAVADCGMFSLAEVVTAVRAGIGMPPRLFPFPPALMRRLLVAAGRGKMAEGLFDDLALDTAALREAFAWEPREMTLEAIAAVAKEAISKR